MLSKGFMLVTFSLMVGFLGCHFLRDPVVSDSLSQQSLTTFFFTYIIYWTLSFEPERKHLDQWHRYCGSKLRRRLSALLMIPMQVLSSFCHLWFKIWCLYREHTEDNTLKTGFTHYNINWWVPICVYRVSCICIYKQYSTVMACLWSPWVRTCRYQRRHNFNGGGSIWRCQTVRSWTGGFQVWDRWVFGSKCIYICLFVIV